MSNVIKAIVVQATIEANPILVESGSGSGLLHMPGWSSRATLSDDTIS